MTLNELITRECVLCDLKATSAKQMLHDMATALIDSGRVDTSRVSVRDIVVAALERERLGSTGVGSGVAVPHARISGVDDVMGVFVRLETPLDYDAIDGRPVDLVVLLVAPEDAGGSHLRALAMISRRLRREDVRARLRGAPDAQSLYISLTDDREAHAA